jgi:hypothetical protein
LPNESQAKVVNDDADKDSDGGLIGMSIAAPFPDASQIVRTEVSHQPESPQRVIRRRPSQTQGQALEKLGRAIEYLTDSRLALMDEPSTKADAEALEILMRLNRCVFSECEEIVSVRQRMKSWIAGRVRVH